MASERQIEANAAELGSEHRAQDGRREIAEPGQRDQAWAGLDG